SGDARTLPPLHSRLTEVQILRSAFDALLSKLLANEQGLRELNADLEARVTERTGELHRAIEETRKGENRVKAIIDTALDAFVGIDGDNRITDWNPRAQEIFGWTREEALGRTVSDTIIPPRFRQAHEAGMKRFAATGSSGIVGQRIQLSALRRTGEEFPVEMTIGLINAGESSFFGAFIQDISVRKRTEDELKESARRLEASERSLRTITNNLPVLIGHVGRDERYRFANATYETWFQMPAAQIVGKSVREVMGEALYAEHAPVLQRSLAGETVCFEVALPMSEGVRTVEITRIPDIHEGVYNGFYVLGADITAARRHQQELSRLARVDTLTGLPNRRAYHERLEAALQRTRRAGSGIAL
ncbi:MAG: hypothetical protein C0489_13300, partial [Candidatus Accumulibacter sp.]|nr:hypothetical protein [Accumulibacter sp.]